VLVVVEGRFLFGQIFGSKNRPHFFAKETRKYHPFSNNINMGRGLWRISASLLAGFSTVAFFELQEQRKAITVANEEIRKETEVVVSEISSLRSNLVDARTQLKSQRSQLQEESNRRLSALNSQIAVSKSILEDLTRT
jgi:uncharacterized protein HemX